MVWSELVQYAQEVGFEEPRLVTASGYSIEDEKLKKIQEKLGRETTELMGKTPFAWFLRWSPVLLCNVSYCKNW